MKPGIKEKIWTRLQTILHLKRTILHLKRKMPSVIGHGYFQLENPDMGTSSWRTQIEMPSVR